MDDIHENDVVALLVDQPDAGLCRGDIGTVIEVFEATADHPGGVIVEFLDESGTVQAEADIVDPSLIVKLRFRPVREAA
ncbi:MAG TPA: DUF4926 domain-containing protein [Pyrinomonadaceae bacterium]|jgi:hypothetical protein|nr:DUF4926 domain-containing protein [Pyrinomonadaceae bacterium]